MNAASSSSRIVWLRRLLLLKAALCFFVWGLPCLVGTARLLAPFGLVVPDDPLSLRLFGAIVIAFGVAYWYAYRDPIRNRAIVLTAVVDNGLATLTIGGVALTTGVTSWFVWLSAGLTACCCVGFVALMPPRTEVARAGAAPARAADGHLPPTLAG